MVAWMTFDASIPAPDVAIASIWHKNELIPAELAVNVFAHQGQ